MRQSEKDLLRSLKSDKRNDDEPLSNVKKGLGSLANVVGNPLFKAEITLQISLYYTIGGGLVAPAAIPLAAQTQLPVYLFGLTDFYGGFLRSQQVNNVGQGWLLNNFGIIQYTAGVVAFPAGVRPFLNPGDLVFSFADLTGTAFGIVVIHCNSITYGTFLSSFVSDLITVNTMRYFVPAANINQMINPFIFAYQTLFGKISTDSIDPRVYKTPDDFQNQIADMPLNFPVDKNLFITFDLNYDCENVSLTLFVEKVEALTHKQVKILKR